MRSSESIDESTLKYYSKSLIHVAWHVFCIFENLVQAKCLRNVDVQWLHGDLRGKSLSFECGNCKLYLLDIKCVKYLHPCKSKLTWSLPLRFLCLSQSLVGSTPWGRHSTNNPRSQCCFNRAMHLKSQGCNKSNEPKALVYFVGAVVSFILAGRILRWIVQPGSKHPLKSMNPVNQETKKQRFKNWQSLYNPVVKSSFLCSASLITFLC